MTYVARTAAFGAALVFACWFLVANSQSADEKEDKVGPFNADILKLADGKESAENIAKKAEQLGDVMQAFKPRSKGGLGVGSTNQPIKPDGIEMKFIDLGKKKSIPDVAKQADAIAKAATITAAISDITLLYAEKDGKKNPAKWKQFTQDMKKASGDLVSAAKKKDAAAIIKAANKINASCNNCHSEFRE